MAISPKSRSTAVAASRTTKRPIAANRGLGRGLTALIPESDLDLLSGIARGDIDPQPIAPIMVEQITHEPELAESVVEAKTGDIRYLSIDDIEPNPFQPRQAFVEQELEDLASSLGEHGVLQPILVRPLADNRFQLIAGERRWRAARRAGLENVPAIVRAVDDRNALELAIIENVQRHDISSVESAQAYRRLAKEFGLSQEQIATRVGKSRAAVANTMRLLDLPTEAIDALREGKISEGHGRALLMAEGESGRRALLRRILRDELTVRDVERFAREGNAADTDGIKPLRVENPDLKRLEVTLQRALGMRFQLRSKRRGGQMIIDFASPEELHRLAKKLTAKK